MSLLLEALKKAELAKQAAKEQPPASGEPPFTRDKLPDISQPMEIHSEDLGPAQPAPAPAPARANKPALELALEEPPRAEPAAPPPRAAPIETDFTPQAEAEERKQAQQLFEAKEMDVNPRKPFYITVGALGLFALGTVGYFWYEMQPKNNYKIPPPSAQPPGPPPTAQAVAPPAAATPAGEPAAPAASTVTPPTGTQPPAAAKAPGTAPAAGAPVAAAPAAVPESRDRTPAARRTAPAAPAAAAAPSDNAIKIKPARAQVDPVLEDAYRAFNAGKLEQSREAYQQVLRSNPDSRDALLGLAAVSMQAKQYEAAESYYTRLLELDPRDALAQAGLIGLKGQINPLSAESRLKNMIATQPEATFLHFSLGNQYAAQGRWVEAQQAYFRAFTGDPEHPDFAYNLAVSLDQMHQTKEALEYYRRALTLAESRPASFDRAQASKRAAQLAH